jgi:hypothetical protein
MLLQRPRATRSASVTPQTQPATPNRPVKSTRQPRSARRHRPAVDPGLEPYSSRKTSSPRLASARVGASMISPSRPFARGCSRLGRQSITFPAAWNQQRCSPAPGNTSLSAAHALNAPSPTTSFGSLRPRRLRSRSTPARTRSTRGSRPRRRKVPCTRPRGLRSRSAGTPSDPHRGGPRRGSRPSTDTRSD